MGAMDIRLKVEVVVTNSKAVVVIINSKVEAVIINFKAAVEVTKYRAEVVVANSKVEAAITHFKAEVVLFKLDNQTPALDKEAGIIQITMVDFKVDSTRELQDGVNRQLPKNLLVDQIQEVTIALTQLSKFTQPHSPMKSVGLFLARTAKAQITTTIKCTKNIVVLNQD